MRVVVNMRLFVVIFFVVIIVAVNEVGGIVLVCVPVGTMVESVPINVMMSHVIVIVGMRQRFVRMGGLPAFALGVLFSDH